MISLITHLKKLKNPAKAKISQGFFKTGAGHYGEGDIFWGITVPEQRKVAKVCLDTSLEELDELIHNPVHEVRLTSLIILTEQYLRAVKKKDDKAMKKIFDFYIAHTKAVNNWDLVDCSAPIISGHYTYTYPAKQAVLRKLVKSKNIWERRIAMVSTLYFIRQKGITLTFDLANDLMKDTHDLIHKAMGWMLREAGKVSEKELEQFLEKHVGHIPRTALRYAIERMPEPKRRQYLAR